MKLLRAGSESKTLLLLQFFSMTEFQLERQCVHTLRAMSMDAFQSLGSGHP